MRCLILAGGRGTRLKPLTYCIPKQLVPVANRPILHFVLDNIIKSGLREIGIIIAPETGNLIKESVENYRLSNPFAQSLSLDKSKESPYKITYITQEEPKGLAHAVKVARGFLGEEPFLMYLGDNLIGCDLKEFVRNFTTSQVDALLLLKEVPNPSLFGVAELSENGEIINLAEKPPAPKSNLALVGVYLFSPAVHKAIDIIKPSPRGELEITDAIQEMLKSNNRVKAFLLNSWWLDTGKKDTLLEANRIILSHLIEKRIAGTIDSLSYLKGQVVVEEASEIKNSKIEGPVVIGRRTKIIDSHIGPFTAIADNCLVENSVIGNSIILEGSVIRGIEQMDYSLIGRNVRVEKNRRSHSLRLLISDDSEVEV